jgi:hypothetical protein
VSDHLKLPEGLADAFAERLIHDDRNEIICLGKEAVREGLETILAQRDAEWREGLLGDAALEAVAKAQHGPRGAGHPFDYVDGEDREWALADAQRTVEAAIDKAAPDGGGKSA